jgi:hypothetical protein
LTAFSLNSPSHLKDAASICGRGTVRNLARDGKALFADFEELFGSAPNSDLPRYLQGLETQNDNKIEIELAGLVRAGGLRCCRFCQCR